MSKKITTITILIISIIIISLFVISTTYSVIIEVLDKDGQDEIINKITFRDLVTDENGLYNTNYYDVINELDITEDEANIIMDSLSLNKALDKVVNSIVTYHLHNGNKLSNNELYDLIKNAVNDDDNINTELKNKILNKSQEYINDISKYLYDIETIYKDKI